MEVVAFLFAFVFYMIVRVLLGHHKNQSYRDRQKYKKGIHLIEIKNYQEAIEYFRKIIHSNPNSAIALAYRGRCHLAMKNYYHALADCSKALNIDYNLKECYLDKGKAHYALQNYQEAFCEFNKAIWHSGDKSAEAFRYRGLMNYHLGDYKKAENDFRNAVRLQDEDANYYLARLANRLDVLE
jgi:tetratricopeptide (TPR) repeat protein